MKSSSHEAGLGGELQVYKCLFRELFLCIIFITKVLLFMNVDKHSIKIVIHQRVCNFDTKFFLYIKCVDTLIIYILNSTVTN